MTAHLATARGERIDWNDIKDRVDMAAIATALFGPAPRRSGRRLLWPCPFHQDRDPSLQVDPAERRWKCWPCDVGGDAPALVMRLKGVGFPEAVRIVAELAEIVAPSRNPIRSRPPARADAAPPPTPPDRAAERPPGGPTGLPEADARALVDEATVRRWTPEGRAAMEYLGGRGLAPETIKAARLGWADMIRMPKRDGSGTWPLAGIVIPWLESGRLTRIKVRRLGLFRGTKYIEAFASGWRVYPGPEAIWPGKPLIIAEGEFDRILLAQELADLASVVTIGSASSRPEESTLLAMLRCPKWFIALDADKTGDKAADNWPARAVRVRPPAPDKDWTEAHQSGVALRRWWTDRLGGIEAPQRSTWDELAPRRWGPGLTDPAPGIIVDRPVRLAIRPGPTDDDDRGERAPSWNSTAG
jgi:hypothetical protein